MKIFLALVAVSVLACGCKAEQPGAPDESATPKRGAVCSSVGKTAKDSGGKTLMCYREDGDFVPRWNEG